MVDAVLGCRGAGGRRGVRTVLRRQPSVHFGRALTGCSSLGQRGVTVRRVGSLGATRHGWVVALRDSVRKTFQANLGHDADG